MQDPASKPTKATLLNIPEDWYPVMDKGAERLGLSRHAYLLRAIQRVLKGESA